MKNKLNLLNRSGRPDFSEFLSHFTKGRDFCNGEQALNVAYFRQMTAFEKLCSILEMKTLKTSIMPWTNTQGLCFTECPWGSLLAHTKQYSSYGIGFTKEFIFQKGGAPVFYMRFKLLNAIKKNISDSKTKEHLLQYCTPLSPTYDTDYARRKYSFVDYTHEREWRICSDLHFEYNNIAFLIIEKHEDYDFLPQLFKEHFDRNKIIVMNNYKIVEDLWPVHIK